MKNSENILILTSLAVALISWLASTYKSGFVLFSAWSMLEDRQTKEKINRGRIGQYTQALAIALVVNIIFAFCVTRDLGLITIFSLFNMFFIGYALTYWILLEEKSKVSKRKKDTWKLP